MTTGRLPGRRARPVLVYDGDCGICTKCVVFVDRRLRTTAEVIAWQDADLPALGLTRAECERAVQWVSLDGRTSAGHVAVGRLLLDSGGLWRLLGAVALVPPFSWIARGIYQLVAINRHRLPGGTPACAVSARLRPGAATRAADAEAMARAEAGHAPVTGRRSESA